ncbi:cytochrome P450 [Halenospora varia]|nr:cytochrome P450 [Halenospora varia]
MKFPSVLLEPHPTPFPFLKVASSAAYLAGLGVSLLAIFYLTGAAYSAYFHPLSKYPGPKLAAASFLPLWYHRYTGNYNPWITSLHDRHGSVVRFSPDGLSFISASAWKDIYGHRTRGKVPNLLDPRVYGQYDNGEDDISTIRDNARHGEVRKIFSRAFSHEAIKLQESLIQGYVDKLINRLRTTVKSNPTEEFNICDMYNRTTFDIMADLAFGESLGLLENDTYTPWMDAMFGASKTEAILDIVSVYPNLRKLLAFFTPESCKKQEEEHYAATAKIIKKRYEKGRDEPDIWNMVLNKGENVLSLNEMHNNASAFMMGGTDTTATLLSGLTYLLLVNPEKLAKVVAEVRELDDEGKLNLAILPGLPYLNACFEEALRVYPPAPEGFPRVIPQGGNIVAGEYIPADTRVSVPQWTINHSTSNFMDPDSFIPERWLPNTGFDTDVKEAMQAWSVGPRNCIGKNLAYQEMRLIFASVIWNFDLKLSEKSQDWIKQKTWLLWERGPMFVQASMRTG